MHFFYIFSPFTARRLSKTLFNGEWKRNQKVLTQSKHCTVCLRSKVKVWLVIMASTGRCCNYTMYRQNTVRKKIWSPADFVVCPLTKKWSVYNFNGRFIWTVRDRITTKKSRKTHFKKVINLHFNESNKYLIPYQSARFLAPRCLLYR